MVNLKCCKYDLHGFTCTEQEKNETLCPLINCTGTKTYSNMRGFDGIVSAKKFNILEKQFYQVEKQYAQVKGCNYNLHYFALVVIILLGFAAFVILMYYNPWCGELRKT